MLQLLIMLFMLAFPNQDYKIVTLEDGSQIVVAANQANSDTGGETADNPPKK